METMTARLATLGVLCATFVAGYVWGAAGTPPVGAEPPADRLARLEANQEILRRVWNVSKETTQRGLRLEPDARGHYVIAGSGSQAESDRTLELARTDTDTAYQRSLLPSPSTP